MSTFQDFCKWIGSQKRAATALGVSEATVSRMASDHEKVSKDIAEKVEAISHGLFPKERVLWPDKNTPTS